MAVTEDLTDVERTAVHVCYMRWKGAQPHTDRPPLYNPSYDERVCSTLNDEETHRVQQRQQYHDSFRGIMTLRTVALDDQLLRATGVTATAPTDSSVPPEEQAYIKQKRPLSSLPVASIRQVVLLGAGLDARAWRLPWPSGVHVYEVDTGSTEKLKQRMLGPLPIRSASRHALQADLTDLARVESVLSSAGFDKSKPAVWVMEGLIGYLTRDAAFNLLSALYQWSAPGSQLLITAPPTKAHRDEQGVTGIELYHSTFEEPTETLARVVSAGWTQAELVTTEVMAEAYELPGKQPQIHAHK